MKYFIKFLLQIIVCQSQSNLPTIINIVTGISTRNRINIFSGSHDNTGSCSLFTLYVHPICNNQFPWIIAIWTRKTRHIQRISLHKLLLPWQAPRCHSWGNDSYIHILTDFRISNIRASIISFPDICRYIVRIRIHSGYRILSPVGLWQKKFHGPCMWSSEFYYNVFMPRLIW